MRLWIDHAVRFLRDEDGPTAVEYAVMLALIVSVCFTAVSVIGSETVKAFGNIALTNALSTGS